ncbi:hypothetical protein GGF43_000659 [Coemansia sp. RSA 2618]|nr:hypothetical protein GGF43_000659 [Coemansia sp. RSA 2618]
MIQSVPLLAGAISKEDIDPTPTSMTGFTLSRCPQYHRALTEAHASSGSFKATAAHFPQNAWASFVDDKTASFRKSRFSVGAFQPGSDRAIDDASDEDKACRRFSALRSAPIRRNISVNSDVATKDPNKTGEPPNAFEQLRYCCEASL